MSGKKSKIEEMIFSIALDAAERENSKWEACQLAAKNMASAVIELAREWCDENISLVPDFPNLKGNAKQARALLEYLESLKDEK